MQNFSKKEDRMSIVNQTERSEPRAYDTSRNDKSLMQDSLFEKTSRAGSTVKQPNAASLTDSPGAAARWLPCAYWARGLAFLGVTACSERIQKQEARQHSKLITDVDGVEAQLQGHVQE